MKGVTEVHVEQATLEWLAAVGWEVGHGPDMSPPDAKAPGTARNTCSKVALRNRPQESIGRLNPHILAGVQYGFSNKAFLPLLAVLPSPEVVNRFNGLATLMFSRMTATERQAGSLVELRDTLLPRLISGKLRLPGDQALADEVSA